MGGIQVANKTHHKDWEAKLQRVWRKKEKTGYITIIEDMFAHENRYEVHREGKPYAFDRTYDSLDEAISMAEASMLEGESMYISPADNEFLESRPLTGEETISVDMLQDAKNEGKREILREMRVLVGEVEEQSAAEKQEADEFDKDIRSRFAKIERDIDKFEKSLDLPLVGVSPFDAVTEHEQIEID